MRLQEAAKGLSEPVRGAAALDVLKEKLSPPREGITGLLSQSEEESITKLVTSHPESEAEDNVVPKQAGCDKRATAGCKDSMGEVVLKTTGEAIPTDDTASPASETKPESIETTERKPSRILCCIGLTASAGESSATSLIPLRRHVGRVPLPLTLPLTFSFFLIL